MAKDTTTATKLSTLSEGGALAPLNLVPGKAGLVPVPPKELAIYDDVEALDDTGLGTVKGADRRIPILRILAGNSPQVTAELPGAKGGAILNTSTGQIYNGKLGLYIIACYLDKKYVKYIKRDDDGGGGGFVAVLEPEDPEVKQRQDERMAKEGNLYGKLLAGFVPEGKPGAGKPMELVETKYMYCVCVVPNEDGSYPGELGEIFEALIPFESTKIKAYDSWIERNKTFTYLIKGTNGVAKKPIAMWSHVWHITTVAKTRGTQSWYIWALALAARDDTKAELHYSHSRIGRNSPLYMQAEKFREDALEGNAQIDFEKDVPQDGDATTAGESGASDGAGERDIPFE
jgi:hypothetical protein